ncbi:NAD(P)-binding domain-containing protein [Rhizobium lusitanum]|uniref:NAD(P)-binding domain-containing protein n=1 Tax=Rhizobium lusitanum TaxID=293958 RepID=UPI0019599470|nr:NAD(P)-binding domain-containing protein [Rhizobium lusitanum]MBM7045521.1 NAD(P)-binding domain-containing protein [Rhizobium lusitanum]
MRIGIAGIGAVGSAVARALDQGEMPGCELAAIAARDDDRAVQFTSTLSKRVPDATMIELAEMCDMVLEALPPSMFEAIALPTLRTGKTLIALSASQLLGRDNLLELARHSGGRIVIPSGAMLGLDSLNAAAVGKLHEVKIITRKPQPAL